jgi:hypothetical protein
MKKILLLLLLTALTGASPLSAQIITGFGTGDINPFDTTPVTGDFQVPWTGTVNTTSLTVSNVSNNAGGIFDTLATPVLVTNTTNFLTLTGQLLSVPAQPKFQITIYDASFDRLVYNFNWTNFNQTTGNSFTGTYDAADSQGLFSGTVGSWGLDVGGTPGDTVSFRFDNLAFTATGIPEPSTYAMFGLGALLLYGYHRRKLRLS